MKRKYKRKSKIETSKRLAITILVVALFDLQLIILAPFFGAECAEEIGTAIIAEIIGVFLTYCLKAFFGKKCEADTKIKQQMISDDLSEEREEGPKC